MKKSRPKKDKAKKSDREEIKPQQPEEKVFDYGGLPPRDLKKNLGCG